MSDRLRMLAEQFSLSKMQEETARWWQDTKHRVVTFVGTAQHKLQHLPETNYNLGVKFARAGKLRDAKFRFQLALKIKPDWAQAHYQLGLCLMRLNQKDEARDAFYSAVRADASHHEARYLLSVCDPSALPENARPTTMPTQMVQGFFESVAANYNAQEVANGYQAPRLIVEALKPHLPSLSGLNVVDGGCGTGLASSLWRKVAGHLSGIDITDAMCTIAREARSADQSILFDKVHHGDVRAMRQFVAPASQHVILVVNVAQFIGDLSGLASECAACLVPGGLLAITTEPYNKAKHFGVVATTGRFGHGAEYVIETMRAQGLSLISQSPVKLYPNFSAHCFVFQHALSTVAPEQAGGL